MNRRRHRRILHCMGRPIGGQCRIWARRESGSRRERVPVLSERGRNITKVSAASQFARSKRALVSGPRNDKKGRRARPRARSVGEIKGRIVLGLALPPPPPPPPPPPSPPLLGSPLWTILCTRVSLLRFNGGGERTTLGSSIGLQKSKRNPLAVEQKEISLLLRSLRPPHPLRPPRPPHESRSIGP
ncbi:hypothetical protein HZH68_008954 [Vespula germanica]|uniref:Uncharacterized protein n=1 Tax=Vespula germanica TaxID=30212 RepID=A0A834K0A8_VESGE|nr:hypothetical protein HZH68_008954 [Vespula germanica]